MLSNGHSQPDTPQQAAVHLLRSLSCCHDCFQSQQTAQQNLMTEEQRIRLVSEIVEMETMRDALSHELAAINSRLSAVWPKGGAGAEQIRQDIITLEKHLTTIIAQQAQSRLNEERRIEQIRLEQQQAIRAQRQMLRLELEAQRSRNVQMKRQMSMLMAEIKGLNRINNQIVGTFCAH